MSLKKSIHHLRYFFSDAWDEFRHSPGVNLMALATLAAALFLAGLLTMVMSNVERGVERRLSDLRVDVFLEDDVAAAQIEGLRQRLEAFEGVASVVFVDPDEALRRYSSWDPQNAGQVEELSSNPLPSSFEVTLAPAPESEARAGELVVDLSKADGVTLVRFDRQWLRSLESLLELAQLAGMVLAILVFGAVVFVIASVLRLAVYARRKEIDIMLLVGATPSFVRGPFLVAGLAQGLAASALALFLVELARRLALVYMDDRNRLLLDWVAARPLPWSLILTLTAVGVLVSFAGSYFAVRRSV